MCEDRYLDMVNWSDVWKARRERNKRSQKGADETRHWERREQAERYARNSDKDYDMRVKDSLSVLPLEPEKRVLDIGSGPGILSIPIARMVRNVTAVEPASGMIDVLKERIEAEGLTNISWIQKTWEDVDIRTDLIPPFDLVISSFSLVMDDIEEAITKMSAVSSGSVYIFTFVDGPLWEQMAMELWPSLHGETYYPGPKADILWNVLYQMGIRANVLMKPLGKTYKFSTFDEAVSFFSKRFGVSDPSQESTLKTYLARVNMAKDRTFLLSKQSIYATVWWNQETMLEKI